MHGSSPKEGTNKVSNAQCDDLLSGIKGASLGKSTDDGDVVQDGNEGHHHHPNANVAHDLRERHRLIGVGVDCGEGRQTGFWDAWLHVTCKGQMDGWMDRLIDKEINGWTEEWMDE